MIKKSACLLLMLFASNVAMAQRPPLVIPDNPDLVLEKLPPGYSGLAFVAQRDVANLPRIQAMLDTAAKTGDTRLSTRAQAMLDRIDPKQQSTDVLRAKAFSAQHRHDFDLARDLLTQVFARDPTDGGALLSRAQVNIVQGHLRQARADCGMLALRVDAALGTVCIAALELRMGDYASAARLADRWLSAPEGDPGLTRFVLMMRGEIASRAREADASHWFQQALDIDPDDVRSRLAFARHLRRIDRHGEALAMLAPATDSDTVLLQRALAARDSGDPDAGSLAAQLGRRFDLARQAGASSELRDEAEYHLVLRRDADRGLALALENFRTQRDIEDVELLERAASLAGKPGALHGLREWAASEHLSLDPKSEGSKESSR